MPHFYWMMENGEPTKIEKIRTVLLPDGTPTILARKAHGGKEEFVIHKKHEPLARSKEELLQKYKST